MKYRKKPVVVEAIEYDGQNVEEIRAFIGLVEVTLKTSNEGFQFMIPTLEGDMAASPGDMIIKGVQCEFYPCKPDIFARTYEPAE
ncbi:MAG: hypothetical protein ACR2PR_03295 [Pseudohongiellaceae bacterium]